MTGELYSRVVAEAAGGKLAADVIDLGDPILTESLADKKIIQKFAAPNADQIPEDLRDPSGFSQVVELPPQVIAYNTQKVKAAVAPKTFKDLLEPKWKATVGMTPIVVGGSAFAVAYTQREKLGLGYWKSLAAQNPKIYSSVVPLTQDLGRGKIDVAVTDLGVLNSEIENGSPLKAVFPQEGTPAFQITSMISATTKKKDAAMVYEAWMASKRGGSVIASNMSVYPSNADSKLPKGLPASVRKNVVIPGLDDWKQLREDWTTEWKRIFDYA